VNVARNLRAFPTERLAPLAPVAEHPDEFVAGLQTDLETVLAVVRRHCAAPHRGRNSSLGRSFVRSPAPPRAPPPVRPTPARLTAWPTVPRNRGGSTRVPANRLARSQKRAGIVVRLHRFAGADPVLHCHDFDRDPR